MELRECNDILLEENYDIEKRDMAFQRVHGTTYKLRDQKIDKGVLLLHGMSGNRYGLDTLSRELASTGYFCLSADLPSHYKNPESLSNETICGIIDEGIHHLRNNYKMKKIGFIGHSIGATAGLMSIGGMKNNLEKLIKSVYNRKITIDSYHEIQSEYKEITYNQKNFDMSADAYVLLAPPIKCKSGIPFLNVLRRLPEKQIRWVIDTFLHNPALMQAQKEGNPLKYRVPRENGIFEWQLLRTKDIYGVLDYIADILEIPDYIKIMNKLGDFENENNVEKVFFKPLKKIKEKPKLFIYGKRDLYLKPFIPFMKRRIDNIYKSFGNSEIFYGNFTHVMMNDEKQQFASVAVKNKEVIEKIVEFFEDKLG